MDDPGSDEAVFEIEDYTTQVQISRIFKYCAFTKIAKKLTQNHLT